MCYLNQQVTCILEMTATPFEVSSIIFFLFFFITKNAICLQICEKIGSTIGNFSFLTEEKKGEDVISSHTLFAKYKPDLFT